ncbi:MAG TPA: hypothetical protein VF345_08150 [Chthoniobacterales bacterium]
MTWDFFGEVRSSGTMLEIRAPLLPSRPKLAIHLLTPLRGNGLLKEWVIK